MWMRRLVVLLPFFLLAACQGNAMVRGEPGSAPARPALLVLNQPLRVAPGESRVLIQHGNVLGPGEWDQYDTFCLFEMRRVAHAGIDLRPGSFTIMDIRRTLEAVVSREQPLRLAGLRLAGDVSGGSKAYHEGYHFMLESVRQPGVYRMSCYGAYADPPEHAPPTMPGIARALGDVASLR